MRTFYVTYQLYNKEIKHANVETEEKVNYHTISKALTDALPYNKRHDYRDIISWSEIEQF